MYMVCTLFADCSIDVHAALSCGPILTPPPAQQTIHQCIKVRDLLARELWTSAEIVGGLALARSRALGSHAESLQLYGDALMGLGECRRALVRLDIC